MCTTRAEMWGGEIVSTITGDHAGHISDYTPLCVKHEPVLLESNQNHATVRTDGICTTLPAAMGEGGGYVPMLVDDVPLCVGNGQLHQVAMSEQANTLDTMHDQQCALESLTVRRLTPMECERLQGFPDGWTDIGDYTDENGKMRHTSDSARYRAMGNSIALPFWFWLLRRISALYERPATLGSLFDGVGGFPLCWERCNGSGTARWASEIEPFCVAVTKRRFGEE